MSQRATVLKILCVPAVVIVLVASTLFLGATSHRLRTGSVAGMLSAVRESVRLQGIPVAQVRVAGSLSTVDDYWAEFFVVPVPTGRPPSLPSEAGFAQFEHRAVDGITSYQWVVTHLGPDLTVGCARVPRAVLRGFRVHCP